MPVTREDLYTAAWNEPKTSVAKRYEISSNYLAHVCAALNVPHPGRGYWARAAAGKRDRVSSLPSARPGDPLVWSPGDPRPVTSSKPAGRRLSRSTPDVRCHHLIAGVREHFEKTRSGHAGFLRPYMQNLVDIFATLDRLPAALDAAHAVFTALERRGHRLTLSTGIHSYRRPEVHPSVAPPRYFDHTATWSPGRATVAYIRDLELGLSLYETTESVRVRYVKGAYVPVSEFPVSRRDAPRSPYEWDTERERPTGLVSDVTTLSPQRTSSRPSLGPMP